MAQVITQQDWIDLGLPGRKSAEVVSGQMGSQSTTLRYVEIPVPQSGDPLRNMHRHNGIEEVIWVLDGEGVFHTPTQRFSVKGGDVIYVPSQEPHVTRNIASRVLKLICFFSHRDVASHTENLTSNDEEVNL